MTIPPHILVWGIGAIFFAGGFQALTLWRLVRIEKMLGNGVPGVFPRREEVKLLIQEAVRRD